MNRLLEIQNQLRDTSEAIALTEKAVADNPKSRSLQLAMRSLEKRMKVLEESFERESRSLGSDVCSYRFFGEVRPTIAAVGEALVEFQTLFSTAYDAIKTGAKKRRRTLPPEIVSQSSMYFGYTFSGSLGIVLTCDDDQNRLFASALDESMKAVIDLALAKTSEEVLARGRLIGVPGVRSMHKWAKAHVDSQLGAELLWRGGRNNTERLCLQAAEMASLMAVIGDTTEVVDEEMSAMGRLVGADIERRTFHAQLENGADVRGTFASSISSDQTFEVGRKYELSLRKRVKVYYSTEAEEVQTFQLLLARAK